MQKSTGALNVQRLGCHMHALFLLSLLGVQFHTHLNAKYRTGTNRKRQDPTFNVFPPAYNQAHLPCQINF